MNEQCHEGGPEGDNRKLPGVLWESRRRRSEKKFRVPAFQTCWQCAKRPCEQKEVLNFEKGAARGLLPDTIERNEQKEKAHSKRGTNWIERKDWDWAIACSSCPGNQLVKFTSRFDISASGRRCDLYRSGLPKIGHLELRVRTAGGVVVVIVNVENNYLSCRA